MSRRSRPPRGRKPISRARVAWHWIRLALWVAFAVCTVATGVDQRCLLLAFAATAVTLGLGFPGKDWNKRGGRPE